MGEKRLRANQSAQSFEENPMDGVANLSDVMLVFICGLLMAIVMYWKPPPQWVVCTSPIRAGTIRSLKAY